jgi:hypothetical protein
LRNERKGWEKKNKQPTKEEEEKNKIKMEGHRGGGL